MPSSKSLNVLVPIDVAHPHADLVADMKQFLPSSQCNIVLLYVKEELPAYENILASVGDFPDDIDHQLERKAKTVLDEVKSDLSLHYSSVKTEIVGGPAALMIETVAKDHHADLIVIAPRPHSSVEKFWLGSVTNNVVKHAATAVLIIRDENGAQPLSKSGDLKVMMAIDGSENAYHAMQAADDFFDISKRAARVDLVHIVSVPRALTFVSPMEFITAVDTNMTMEGETFLAEAEKILADRGIKNVTLHLKKGDASQEIIELAKKLTPDLLVIGAKGRTAVQHFLMGSVSARIAMQAPCCTAVFKSAG